MKGEGKWALLTWAGNYCQPGGGREGSHLVLIQPQAPFQMCRGPTCHRHLPLTPSCTSGAGQGVGVGAVRGHKPHRLGFNHISANPRSPGGETGTMLPPLGASASSSVQWG